MQSISSYINPNTRGLTSNYKNTAIKDKETYNEAMSQHLLNPVEDLVQVLKTPIKLAKSSSLSRQNNSVNIAEGQRIRVNGGHVLTVTAHGVEVSGGDNPYDTQSYVKAQRMADALAACLLLPEDAVKDAMFVYGLGDKVKVLSRKYSEYKYQCFCEMADALGVSRSALSFRMEQLGLLERNELIAEARARRGVG